MRNLTEAETEIYNNWLEAEAVNVKPVKRGYWIHLNDDGIIFCSQCHKEAYWDTDYGQQLFDYCPYCGAYMRESDKTKR